MWQWRYGEQIALPLEVRMNVAREARVRWAVDDSQYVVIDLGLDTRKQAEGILHFLKARVWDVAENAPAQVGAPQTMILEAAAPG